MLTTLSNPNTQFLFLESPITKKIKIDTDTE